MNLTIDEPKISSTLLPKIGTGLYGVSGLPERLLPCEKLCHFRSRCIHHMYQDLIELQQYYITQDLDKSYFPMMQQHQLKGLHQSNSQPKQIAHFEIDRKMEEELVKDHIEFRTKPRKTQQLHLPSP